MSAEFYNKRVREWFLARPAAFAILKLSYRYLTFVIVAAYCVLLLLVTWKENENILFYLDIPAAVFFVTTLIRKIRNQKRPYELGYQSLIKKEKCGQSMPSRHVASGAIISFMWLWYSVPVGVALFLVTIGIAVSRVLAGVHFIRDVVAGFAGAVLLGSILVFILA